MSEFIEKIERFTYKVPSTGESVCRVRAWRFNDGGVVVIATELVDNPGPSVTNSAVELIAALAAHYQVRAGALLVIEHYEANHFGLGDELDQERFALVDDGDGPIRWHALTLDHIELKILGTRITA